MQEKRGKRSARLVHHHDYGGNFPFPFQNYSKCDVFLFSPSLFLVVECYNSGLGLPGLRKAPQLSDRRASTVKLLKGRVEEAEKKLAAKEEELKAMRWS